MNPAAIVFIRIPWAAYSMAIERVAASIPPLMRIGSALGIPAMGWAERDVPMLTM